MARETSERFPSYPIVGAGVFSIFIYGMCLLLVIISLYGIFDPGKMSFFGFGRGIFVLTGIIGLIVLISEISLRTEISNLKDRIQKLEREKKKRERKG